MKITIDIPKEFEEHWKDDRFEDSLSRLKADAHCLAGNYEKETMSMLIKAFNNATDVVEVVRCKDCVNCTHLVYEYDRNEEWWCGANEVVPDGFCNYGERRNDVSKSD